MEITITNTEEMDVFALKELEILSRTNFLTQETHATVLGLSGELGAGKTAFVKSFAKALGVIESVPSPTFVIARFYPIKKHSRFTQLVHIDAYRIESLDELRPLGWEKLLNEKTNLIVVEWPENMKEKFPADARMLHFTVVDETTRMIRA